MAYGDDTFSMLGDDSLFMPSPLDAQAALAANVRRNPALVTPSSGVQTPKPRPPAQAPAEPVPTGPTSADLLRQITEQMHQRPDTSAYVQQAKARGDQSDRDLVLALTLGAQGGEKLSPFAGQFLQRSMKDSGDYEIPGGWGTVGRGGEVVWNPAKLQENELARMTKLYDITSGEETKREVARDRAVLARTLAGQRADAAADRAASRADAEAAKRTDTVRREYNTRRDKIVQGSAFADQVVQQLADPNLAKNAPGQVALVMQFGKMLDPDSVVREAEQRMIAQARGWFDSLMITPERIMSGQFLTPQQLAQMRQIALQYQQGYGQRVTDLNDFYTGIAERNRLPTADIIQGGGAAIPEGAVRQRGTAQPNTRRSTDAAPDEPPPGAVRPRGR